MDLDLSRGVASSTHLIMPDDTNPLGSLFGGRAVEWMDIAAGLAAIRLCAHHCVTASIERLDFRVPVRWGQVAVVEAQVIGVGRTSMQVQVNMYREDPRTGQRELCTRGLFHMVALDDKGKPTPVLSAPAEGERV
jgi:acyl-CoA hydrolase